MSTAKPLYAVLFCSLLWLTGCQHMPQPQAAAAIKRPALPKIAAASLQQVPAFDSLIALTPAQQADFIAYFQDPSRHELSPGKRIGQYMDDYLQDFQYQMTTLTASETLAQRRGNCISLALLTQALARLVKVEVRYQLSYREPVYDLQQGMLISVNHIRSYVMPQLSNQPGSLLAAAVIDYFPGPRSIHGAMISQQSFAALVYNNLAAEAWFAGQPQLALAQLGQALIYAPDDHLVINSLAVMLKQQGQLRLAKAWYQYGATQPTPSAQLLENYQLFAEQTGDDATYQQLTTRLATYPGTEDDPYMWFNMAQRAEQRGQYASAYRYYQRVLARAPAFLPATQKLLKHYLEQQKTDKAQQLLETALFYSYGADNRQRYQQKLAALQQWSRQDKPVAQ